MHFKHGHGISDIAIQYSTVLTESAHRESWSNVEWVRGTGEEEEEGEEEG